MFVCCVTLVKIFWFLSRSIFRPSATLVILVKMLSSLSFSILRLFTVFLIVHIPNAMSVARSEYSESFHCFYATATTVKCILTGIFITESLLDQSYGKS